METLKMEGNKQEKYFDAIKIKMDKKMDELGEDTDMKGMFVINGSEKIAESEKLHEWNLSELQKKIRAMELVLREAEILLSNNPTSHEFYQQAVVSAKILAFYRQIEKTYYFVVEAEERKEREPHFAQIADLMKEEMQTLYSY